MPGEKGFNHALEKPAGLKGPGQSCRQDGKAYGSYLSGARPGRLEGMTDCRLFFKSVAG